MIINNLRTCLFLLAVGSFATLGGCEAFGVASESAGHTVNAKYVPNQADSMLVLVESYQHDLSDSGIEAEHLSAALTKAMADDKIASLVDPQSLEKLRDADPDQFAPMSIAEIGRRVGAKQVLYVNIDLAEIEHPIGGGQMRGRMEAIVKIVDSTTGNTRWPRDSSSETMQITTDWIPDNAHKTDADVRAQMADQMAQDIGKMFHDYNVDEEPLEKVNVDG
jgi:hypothetical protein